MSIEKKLPELSSQVRVAAKLTRCICYTRENDSIALVENTIIYVDPSEHIGYYKGDHFCLDPSEYILLDNWVFALHHHAMQEKIYIIKVGNKVLCILRDNRKAHTLLKALQEHNIKAILVISKELGNVIHLRSDSDTKKSPWQDFLFFTPLQRTKPRL